MDSSSDNGFNSELIGVQAIVTYLPSHSRPEDQHFTFAYTISISNAADQPVQLLSRHWVITDAEQQVQEVRGDGVVGEQPVIGPGETFRYTSGASIPTPVGCMEGSYFMVALPGASGDSDAEPAMIEVPIPAFSLHLPTAVH